jgi:hypothetical protein
MEAEGTRDACLPDRETPGKPGQEKEKHMTPWELRGQEMVNCNCNFGCPCQFSVLPTGGSCRAAIVYQIDRGRYGDVALDGLRVAAVYSWPKAIHDGDGQMQLIVDESAEEAQCRAIETIMTGGDTEEMATMWFVYSRMSPNKHPTIRAPISLEMDQEARTGRARVGEVFELHAKPVPHVVTGARRTVLVSTCRTASSTPRPKSPAAPRGRWAAG